MTLDVSQLLTQLGLELGIPQSALDNLLADAGQDQDHELRPALVRANGCTSGQFLSVWLLVLVFLLYGLAIYLAHGARRKTLLHVGWALVIVGLLELVARRVIGNYVINSLAQPEYRTPTHHVWLVVTEILGQIGWAVVLYGLLIVIGSALAGPSRIATSIRREVAPILNVRAGLTWGISPSSGCS